MKLLLTKKLDEKYLIDKLDRFIDVTSMDFIKIKYESIPPFPLDKHSIIFTSTHGIKGFLKNDFLKEMSLKNKIYVVGEKTSRELTNVGLKAEKIFPDAQHLAIYLVEHSKTEKFLHFCSNIALDTVEKELSSHKIDYHQIIVYETELLYPIINEKFDAVAFFSPSGVRSYAKNNALDGVKIFSIGATTADEIKNYTTNKIYRSPKPELNEFLAYINNTLYNLK